MLKLCKNSQIRSYEADNELRCSMEIRITELVAAGAETGSGSGSVVNGQASRVEALPLLNSSSVTASLSMLFSIRRSAAIQNVQTSGFVHLELFDRCYRGRGRSSTPWRGA